MTPAERLATLFAGLTRAYGVYAVEAGNAAGKRKGKAETLHGEVNVALWERHLRGEIQLGIVPIRDDGTCVFGAIDIDVYPLDHSALAAKIAKLKLPLLPVRSKSGGAHLYNFYKAATEAEEVRELLCEWAAALGYGGVEVFPKQSRLLSVKDTGNWINMPYSGGDNLERCGMRAGTPIGLEAFLDWAEKSKINLAKARRTAQEPPELLTEGPPCLVTLTATGAPEGGRNSVLFNLGVYARKRWPEDWIDRMAELNAQLLSPPLSEAEVNGIIAHLRRKEYNFTCNDRPLNSVCVRAQCIKRQWGVGVMDIMGLNVEHVLRLDMERAQYFADFNGARVQFDASDLVSQNQFRERMINQTNKSFPILSAKMWSDFTMKLCDKAETIEAPPETQVNAEIAGWLEEYCTESVPGAGWEDVIDGQVLEQEGRMYLRPQKFIAKISRDHRTTLKMADAYSALQSYGVRSEEREIEERKYRVWSVPAYARAKRRKSEGLL